ncbi:MAG: hypothetical protein MZV64_28495 [Ignavibacteriales bacterium]|nr:hypothetical protein [Ignavibacteriales bacterium]
MQTHLLRQLQVAWRAQVRPIGKENHRQLGHPPGKAAIRSRIEASSSMSIH